MPLLLAFVPLLAQGMLPGCTLVEGNLQCVPGQVLPENQQIKLLNQEAYQGQQQEGPLLQNIQELERSTQ
jgi:hypothetical protein